MFSNYITGVKSGWLDLNQRLLGPKPRLLAAELHPVHAPSETRSRSVAEGITHTQNRTDFKSATDANSAIGANRNRVKNLVLLVRFELTQHKV